MANWRCNVDTCKRGQIAGADALVNCVTCDPSGSAGDVPRYGGCCYRAPRNIDIVTILGSHTSEAQIAPRRARVRCACAPVCHRQVRNPGDAAPGNADAPGVLRGHRPQPKIPTRGRAVRQVAQVVGAIGVGGIAARRGHPQIGAGIGSGRRPSASIGQGKVRDPNNTAARNGDVAGRLGRHRPQPCDVRVGDGRRRRQR